MVNHCASHKVDVYALLSLRWSYAENSTVGVSSAWSSLWYFDLPPQLCVFYAMGYAHVHCTALHAASSTVTCHPISLLCSMMCCLT